MNRILCLAGAAALAISASAAAKPGGNGGGGKGQGGGGPAKVERGGGGGGLKADRGGGQQRAFKAERGPDRREMRAANREARGPDRPAKAERRMEQRQARAERAPRQRDVRVERAPKQREVRAERRIDRVQAPVREVRAKHRFEQHPVRTASEQRYEGGDRPFGVSTFYDGTRYVGGSCPPGLAAKNNGCLPPGQAKKLVGQAVPAAILTGGLLPSYYRSWYPDTDEYYYRTDDGYLYRIDRDTNLVDAYFPVHDDEWAYYPVGASYPSDWYGYYNVPAQYDDYYADNDEWAYRYGDGAIYRVDQDSGIIDSIVALLAGDLGVGAQLPAGYDVYNVPYQYRDRYADSSDAWYRYNDGYIYEVDPQTRIIQSVIEALV